MPHKIIGFLEDIIQNEVFFESVVLAKNDLPINFMDKEINYWSLNINNLEEGEFLYNTNYYYKIYIKKKEADNCIKVILKNNKKLKSFLQQYNLISDDQEVVWIDLKYDFELTENMHKQVEKNFSIIKKIEKLYYSFLKVSEKDIYPKDEFEKWLLNKNKLGDELSRYVYQNDNYNNDNIVNILNKISSSFDSEIWIEKNNRFREHLLNILENTEDDEKIIMNFNRLLEFKGIGRTSLSKILNYIEPIKFPIFSKELFDYFELLGYETGKNLNVNHKNSQGIKYNNYRKNLLRIIESIYNFINKTDELEKANYDKINYFIRKKLKIVDIS